MTSRELSSILNKIKDTLKKVSSYEGTSFCAGHAQRAKQFGRRWYSTEAVSCVSRKKGESFELGNCSAGRRQNAQV